MMNAKPHLAWIGHIGSHTGLARVADNILRLLSEFWRITVIAISMPHPNYTVSWATILPAQRFQDWMGRLVLMDVVRDDPPDVTVLFADPWVLEMFLHGIPDALPLVGYLPMDGTNLKAVQVLDRLSHAIFLSPFALTEARLAGYEGPASVLGHGVDLALYHPLDQTACRAALGLPLDAVLVGNVGQNQPRKRWDLTLQAFQMLHEGWGAAPPLRLYCHCQPQDVVGWDLPQLARVMGLSDVVLFPRDLPSCGYDESQMPLVYNSLDLQWSTSWGEGFGLTTLEGMACGVPQVIPAHTALAEWARPGACMLDATTQVVAPGGQNLIGWTLDPVELALTTTMLLSTPSVYDDYRRLGLALAQRPAFRWETLAALMHTFLAAEVCSGTRG
jgi:glycosyltransferase involved in cell wall biosynthesis